MENMNNAIWFKLEKDRTVQIIPVFTDYSVSTVMGTMLYDKDIVPCKQVRELFQHYADETRAWFLNFDVENTAHIQAMGISIPAEMETVSSLTQLRHVFNQKLSTH
jgi:hypothetical protein